MNADDEKDALESTVGGRDIPLAKLSMPRLAGGIARPRLFNWLDKARAGPAIWIVAPGGAGKTTLAATYITEHEIPFLWYQLDKDDADPATFFYYLGIAARKLTTSPDAFLPLLTPEYLPDIPGFARRYFRQMFSILPRGTVLVLDNHQSLIGEAVFNGVLRAAIGEIPDQGNIFIISRTDPPPALARQRANGSLAIIDWEKLRLTLEEAEIIVSRTSDFDKTVMRALHQRSEGWVAGLILLMEQMKRKGDIKQVFSVGSLQGYPEHSRIFY